MSAETLIRVAVIDDAGEIWSIYRSAVRSVGTGDYGQEQLAAWLEGAGEPSNWEVPISRGRILVACHEDFLLGFGQVNVEMATIDALYVRPDCKRRGIGRQLLSMLEDLAAKGGCGELRLDASLNAVTFYLKCGYEAGDPGLCSLPGGTEMPCIPMRKKVETVEELTGPSTLCCDGAIMKEQIKTHPNRKPGKGTGVRDSKEIPGLVPARPGAQPVTDLGSFLAEVPDFGEDAVALDDAIRNLRAWRRAAAAEKP